MGNLFELCVLIIVVTFCLYLVIDRVCRCVEHSNLAKSYKLTLDSEKQKEKEE